MEYMPTQLMDIIMTFRVNVLKVIRLGRLKVEGSLECKITQRSNSGICQITTASQKFKSGKSDPLLNLSSDFFLNVPPILYNMLTVILRGYVTHALVSDFYLFQI